jgi:hypothetical protein
MAPIHGQASPGQVKRPRVRLRTPLAFVLAAGGVWWTYPRVLATIRLHDSASILADYALCMAGPTGAGLVRDNPTEFRRLVRRRVIGALPDERLFARCAKAARVLTASPEVEQAHHAAASRFVEYGGSAEDPRRGGSRSVLSVAALDVSSVRLGALAREAWPLEREGYSRLVRPSLSAFEAVHPVAPARPGIGWGLPGDRTLYRSIRVTDRGWLAAFGHGAHLQAMRSLDEGTTWASISPHVSGVMEWAERCPAGEGRAYTFGMSSDGQFLTVTSSGPDHWPFSTVLGPSELDILAASADDTTLVVALAREPARDVSLRLCRYGQGCGDLAAPAVPGVGTALGLPLDIARVKGVTVLAVNMRGLVRVSSSRDDGRSWTPFTVAFDPEAYPDLRTDVAVPDRLLVAGGRLLLYGATRKPSETYPLLFSDDFGASWRSPRGDSLVARADLG